MTLKELLSEWEVDAKIDKDEAGIESTKIPQLHAKYMKLLSTERLRAYNFTTQRKKLQIVLEDYFEGRIDGTEINRPPYQFLIGKTKERLPNLVDTDSEMMKLNEQVAITNEKILLIKEIVVQLNQRNFQIKNLLEWTKWSQGNG